MQAVILAGGKGTRLRPFTATLPKPLVPVGDHPIIEIVLRQLKHFGFRDAIISTGHLAELIQAYCGDGRRWGIKIRYVREDKPLGTSGALKLIRGLKSDFMTINGDVLTTLDFSKVFAYHRKKGGAATVALCERVVKSEFGVIELDGGERLARYIEKPEMRHLVSMGVNIYRRGVLELIGRGETLGVPELITRLQASGQPVYGYVAQADWLDIGRPDDYQTAQELFSDPRRRAKYLP